MFFWCFFNPVVPDSAVTATLIFRYANCEGSDLELAVVIEPAPQAAEATGPSQTLPAPLPAEITESLLRHCPVRVLRRPLQGPSSQVPGHLHRCCGVAQLGSIQEVVERGRLRGKEKTKHRCMIGTMVPPPIFPVATRGTAINAIEFKSHGSQEAFISHGAQSNKNIHV